MTKAELRRRLVAQLRAWLSEGRRDAASEAVCQTIAAHRAWREARLVCAFLPLPSEPSIVPLWEREGGPDFCFPRVSAAGLDLIRPSERSLLRGADWRLAGAGLADAPLITPESVDLFLVPGLAFSRDGRRLGRGGGFYDRLLPRRGRFSMALGVCFSVQLVDDLPMEAHDRGVDAVITELGVAG